MSTSEVRKDSAAVSGPIYKTSFYQKQLQGGGALVKKQQSFRVAYGIKEGTKTSSKTGHESVEINEAINSLVFGSKIIKYSRKGKSKHLSFFYLLETDLNQIQWLSRKKNISISRIKLSDIKNLSSTPHIVKIAHQDSSNMLCLQLEGGREFVLEFQDCKMRDVWWKGILFLREYSLDLDISNVVSKEVMIKKMILGIENENSLQIGPKEVKEILKKLMIQVQDQELLIRIQKISQNGQKHLKYDELIKLILSLLEKSEIEPIFKKYCANPSMILHKDVKKFFSEEQGENFDDKQILEKMNKLYPGCEHKIINYLAFCQMIFTSENSIFDPKKVESYSLDRPFSDYYINTSFRSHLAYDISSHINHSTRGYIYLLQKGVRHFDLMITEGENWELEVKQGVSQNISVSLLEITNVIKQKAFETNLMPVIINLEHDCSVQSQEKIADILVQTFGDSLYKLPENFISLRYLPSPNELKKKVILRAKGRLANIISQYEKKVSKRVEEREQLNKQIKEKSVKNNEQQLLDQKKKKESEEEARRKLLEQEKKKSENINNDDDEDEEEEESENSFEAINHYKQQKSSKHKSDKQKKKQRKIQQKTTAKELSTMGKSVTSGFGMTSFHAGSEPKEADEIEQLIDLELNLDKEYLNDDSYAASKTNQISSFHFQQSKTLVTANREFKSLVTMQLTSHYSLIENPKEALQRKMRTDQQLSFFEASPSLKSQQSNKNRRPASRSSSVKQIPHFEIGFKSDLPPHDYHNSNGSINKEELDSPAYIKHPSGIEKKRHSLLYKPRKRASVENIQQVGSLLNNQNIQTNELSQREIIQSIQNGSFSMQDSKIPINSSSSDEREEILSQAIFLDHRSNNTGVNNNCEELIPASSVMNTPSNNLLLDTQSYRNDNISFMQSSLMIPTIQLQKTRATSQTITQLKISNALERCIAFFACKFKQQNELSIWSCSQLNDQKITNIIQRAMMGEIDDSQDFINHSSKYLLLIKPKQSINVKGDLINFDFIHPFSAGCQFCGLSYSIKDAYLLVYSQFFLQNANLGFIEKPKWLLSDSSFEGASFYSNTAQKAKLWVKIEVISAMSLRIPYEEEKKIVPLITIRLVGTLIDMNANNTVFMSTDSPISSFNPQFDSLIADFTVYLPELAFLVFTLFESKDNLVLFAQYAIPVSCMRKGFRSIPLLDSEHNIIPNSFLFTHVIIEELTQQQDTIAVLNPQVKSNPPIEMTQSSHQKSSPQANICSIQNISFNPL